MGSIIVAVLMLLGRLFSYALATSPQNTLTTATPAVVPTELISCESQSTDQDLREMLALVDGAFDSSDWTQQFASYDARTTLTWLSNSLGAVAFLEYLHYDCGVTQAQIDSYFSPAGFETTFSNYRSYQQTAACRASGLELFEFEVVTSYGAKDHALYWVEQTSTTRVADLLLVMPDDEQSQQAEYAGKLFPELPSCQAASG